MNRQQEEAATSLPGYVQIVAGPGTGKTRTLVARIVHFIQTGMDPRKIIVMTFTNQAAKEVRSRVAKELYLKPNQQPMIGTFHGIASRILGISGVKVSIANEQDKRQLIKKLCLNTDYKDRAAKFTSKISYFKARGIEPSDTDPVRPFFDLYNAELQHYGLMDFDDLLLQLKHVLSSESSPYWQKAMHFCYSIQAVLVDEFQDTNVTQLELADLLAKYCRNLTVVGDPDQSIYGFRNAEPRNFRRLVELQPSSKLLYLEENYRSSTSIINLAMEIINRSTERYGKNRLLKSTKPLDSKPVTVGLSGYEEEARQVCDQICSLIKTGVRKDEIAVLARRARSLSQLEANLVARGVAVQVVGGTKLSESPEVRVIVDYLRVIASDTDELAISRAVNIPKRGIGPAAIKKIFGNKLELTRARTSDTGTHARGIRSFLKIIDDCREILKKETTIDTLKEVVNYLVRALASEFDDKGMLRINLLRDTITQTDFASDDDLLGNFIAMWTLSTTAPSKSENVVLSTIHSAKGLEWPVVYILDCGAADTYDGNQSDEEDEERRLVYVAATRAQALLTITFSLAMGPHTALPPGFKAAKKLDDVDTVVLGDILGRKLKPYKRIDLASMPGFTMASSLPMAARRPQAPLKPAKGFVPLSQVFGRPSSASVASFSKKPRAVKPEDLVDAPSLAAATKRRKLPLPNGEMLFTPFKPPSQME